MYSKHSRNPKTCQASFDSLENKAPSRSAGEGPFLSSVGALSDHVESSSDHAENRQESPLIPSQAPHFPPASPGSPVSPAPDDHESLNLQDPEQKFKPGIPGNVPEVPGDPRGSGGSFSYVLPEEISPPKKGKKLGFATPGKGNDFNNRLLPMSSGDGEAQEISRAAIFRDFRLTKIAHKMDACGKETVSWTCKVCELRPWVRVYCGVRVCSICYWRKFGAKFKARREPLYKEFAKRKGTNGKDRLMHVVLTTINTGRFPSRERVKLIENEAVKFLRERFKAWDVVVELKLTKTGPFLHIHAVVYGDYIPKVKLGADWEAITGAKNVWIEAIKNHKEAVSYLSSYLGKAVPLDNYEMQARYLKAFKGLRRVRTGGLFDPRKGGFEVEAKDNREKLNFRECPRCGTWGLFFNREAQGITVLKLIALSDPWQVFNFTEAYRLWRKRCPPELVPGVVGAWGKGISYEPAQKVRKAA